MNVRRTCPSEDQARPTGYQDGCYADDADHGFGVLPACLRVFLVRVNHAPQKWLTYDGQYLELSHSMSARINSMGVGSRDTAYSSNANAHITKTDKSWRPSTELAEDDWIADETKIQYAIHESNVYVPEDANGLLDSHAQRSIEVFA